MSQIINDDDSEEKQIDKRTKPDVVHKLPKPLNNQTINGPNLSMTNSHIP